MVGPPSSLANVGAALTLLRALRRGGMAHVVLCPGSRSAPLAVAAALLAPGGLRLHTAIGERSAAFFALGLGRGSGQPAAVITTSGTAVANLATAVTLGTCLTRQRRYEDAEGELMQGIALLEGATGVGASDLETARAKLGGNPMDKGNDFWRDIREHRHEFFQDDAPLWRLSVPSAAKPVGSGGEQLIEWGGALRWLRSARPAAEIRAKAGELGGHATLFRGGDRSQGVFTPLSPPLAAIHRRLKDEFDPSGLFNPGRMYVGL